MNIKNIVLITMIMITTIGNLEIQGATGATYTGASECNSGICCHDVCCSSGACCSFQNNTSETVTLSFSNYTCQQIQAGEDYVFNLTSSLTVYAGSYYYLNSTRLSLSDTSSNSYQIHENGSGQPLTFIANT